MAEEVNKTVAVSGGFDPIHVGHIRMIRAAAEYGDVIVIANTDRWLAAKKDYVFMTWSERAEILKSIKGVVDVVEASDHDGTVCETLVDLRDAISLDYFANGGDRKIDNTPEMNICELYGIEMIWNIGGGKIQSSSEIVARQKNKK
jgi:cytidyltransferase-like protein